MSEPQRLKEKYAGQLEGAVLGSARIDVPSARARRRTLVTLGVAATATGLPVATTAAAGAKTIASVGLAVTVKWGGIGLAVGALTLGGIREAPRWVASRTPSSASTAAGRPAPAPHDRSIESAPRVGRDTPPAEAVVPIAPAAPIAPEESARARHPAPARKDVPPAWNERTAASSPDSRLAEEIIALDQARQTLKTQPAHALELLDEYVGRFPSGELRPEALVLRIDALVRSERRQAAEALGNEYLSGNPRSPHAKRIRTLMGWSEAR